MLTDPDSRASQKISAQVVIGLGVTERMGSGSAPDAICGAGPGSVRADAAGRLVRTAWIGKLNRRAFTVAWDGRDDSGRKAATGISMVRLESGTGRVIHRLGKLLMWTDPVKGSRRPLPWLGAVFAFLARSFGAVAERSAVSATSWADFLGLLRGGGTILIARGAGPSSAPRRTIRVRREKTAGGASRPPLRFRLRSGDHGRCSPGTGRDLHEWCPFPSPGRTRGPIHNALKWSRLGATSSLVWSLV
jgi:hypothetical protein